MRRNISIIIEFVCVVKWQMMKASLRLQHFRSVQWRLRSARQLSEREMQIKTTLDKKRASISGTQRQ